MDKRHFKTNLILGTYIPNIFFELLWASQLTYLTYIAVNPLPHMAEWQCKACIIVLPILAIILTLVSIINIQTIIRDTKQYFNTLELLEKVKIEMKPYIEETLEKVKKEIH